MSQSDSKLLIQLRELDQALRDRNVAYAAIGGIAVNLHGHVRATRDLDVMVAAEDTAAIRTIAHELGYQALSEGTDLSSYVRGQQRLDILHAHRPISRNLLARASAKDQRGLAVPLIPVEGLIGLKLQAFNDDARRLHDLTDMIELFRIHGENLDMDEVRTYFRLFDRETLLDDILAASR